MDIIIPNQLVETYIEAIIILSLWTIFIGVICAVIVSCYSKD